MRIYRESEPAHTLCEINEHIFSHSEPDFNCHGHVSSSDGYLMVDFHPILCDDEDSYVCESNPEASTKKRTTISVTS